MHIVAFLCEMNHEGCNADQGTSPRHGTAEQVGERVSLTDSSDKPTVCALPHVLLHYCKPYIAQRLAHFDSFGTGNTNMLPADDPKSAECIMIGPRRRMK